MKKITLTLLTILVLTLTACGNASDSPTADPAKLTVSSENALPVSTQLLVGIFKLEGTDLAVTAEQADELIPLWQVLQSLSSSDTAAQEEMDALVDQIQETMTVEQVQAIQAMNLTPQDMFATMQEQGIAGQGGQMLSQAGSSNSEGGAVPVAPAGGGDQIFVGPGGGGGPPGGVPGGGMGGGQNLNPEQIATMQARRTENGGGGFQFNGTPAPLIEALVKFLQEKSGS